MKTFIIVCHGDLSNALLNSMKMIIGEIEGISTITFSPEQGVPDLFNNMKEIADKKESNDEIIIFTDLFGGSPYNAAMQYAVTDARVHLISGVNLPVLIEAYMARDQSIDSILRIIFETNKNALVYFDKESLENEGDDL